MPATATYSFFYYLGETAPTTGTVYPGAQPVSNTITDNRDGADDNQTPVDGDLSWSESGQDVEIIGTAQPSGDPIVQRVVGPPYPVYQLSNDGSLQGSTLTFDDTTPYTYCFAPGSLISTPDGETYVENLQAGANLRTAKGDIVAVKWIGRQTVRRLFAGTSVQPVRIRANAFGDGIPHTDLTVTGDHGMILDGVVINASALVNGTTIDWVPMKDLPDSVTYYHVETENHDVILANGAAAETFIDYVGRQAFDNYAEYVDLYGDDRTIDEMPLPRISAARLVPGNIKMRLSAAVTKVA
ncbi:Hint domain-containing protein [Roseovarius confluentis]|uniref:Hint domain-containing protein n=1 Tax=Roseovarius confluentis TaxID=1852027 RepID=UPI001FE5F9F2|nr:Hint domain-containing protein [Roseovarius confluentis]